MPRKKRKTETLYHVEVVTKARVNPEGVWEYFVKWAGYDSDADSWEPAENVADCKRLLKSFWTHIGIDDEDYAPGYMVEASPDWIITERQYFATEYKQQQREARKQREREEKSQKGSPEKQAKTLSRQGSSNVEKKPTVPSSVLKGKAKQRLVLSSDEDETPLATIIRIPPQKRRAPSTDSDDVDSNDRKPPLKAPKTGSTSSVVATKGNSKGKQKAEPPPHTPSALTKPTLESSPDSLFSAPPSPKPTASANHVQPGAKPKVQDHRDRRNNPLVKTLPPPIAPSGSALSTKNRIAQTILQAENPSATKKYSNLSFKKQAAPSKPQDLDSEVQRPSDPILTPDDLLQSPIQMNGQIDDSPLFVDPFPDGPSLGNDVHPDQDFGLSPEYDSVFASFVNVSSDISPVARAPSPPPTQRLVRLPSVGKTEADVFLQSLMPSELAAPLVETPEVFVTPRRPVPTKPALPKIPKKWKWTGELFIDVEQDKAERLCEIMLTDSTDYLPEGLRLNVLFSDMDSIRFGKFLDLSDLDVILPACKPSEQVAKLAPNNESDVHALKGLIHTMESEHKFTFFPLGLAGREVAMLLVFPSALEILCHTFKVPKDLQQSDSLMAVVVPWAISSEVEKEEWRKPSETTSDAGKIIASATDGRDRTLRRRPHYCRALSALQFPKSLHDHMLNRTFCIWDGRPTNDPSLETRSLSSILRQCKALDVGLKSDVRVIFVHVGAMKTLPSLPALAERRTKRSEIQFFTYGTHESVPQEQWGIREIFPLGGIATFTPSVILEDPIDISKLISQFAKHPFWDCYLLPSVMGMVAKLACEDQDPLSVLNKGEFIYDVILDQIEQGEVALISAPPLTRCPLQDEESAFAWIGKQCKMLPAQTHGLLEECVKEFSELFLNMQEREWASAMEKEISKDLKCMQMQPAIMDDYRRFVIIKGSKDNHISENRDGLEWVTLDNFKFRDDCFTPMHSQPKQDL